MTQYIITTTEQTQTLKNKTISASDNTIQNIDVGNLKTKTASDKGKSFLVKSDGTWELGSVSATPDDVTIENNSDSKLQVKDGGLTVAKMNSNAVSTTIPSTGAVDTKLATEKAVADTVIVAGTGLTKTNTTLDHSNSVTAGTDKFGKVSYDAQGHVSAFTDVTLPKTGGIEIDSSNQLVHANDDITAIANNTLVALSCDLKGHITGYAERPIVTAWSATTADTNIPSEKLVKTALNNSEEWTITFTDSTTATKNMLLKQ